MIEKCHDAVLSWFVCVCLCVCCWSLILLAEAAPPIQEEAAKQAPDALGEFDIVIAESLDRVYLSS